MDPTEKVDCPNCYGHGHEPEVVSATGGPVPCDVCDGAGWIFRGEDDAHLPDCYDPDCIACGSVEIPDDPTTEDV